LQHPDLTSQVVDLRLLGAGLQRPDLSLQVIDLRLLGLDLLLESGCLCCLRLGFLLLGMRAAQDRRE
jgi:hypothetical protein